MDWVLDKCQWFIINFLGIIMGYGYVKKMIKFLDKVIWSLGCALEYLNNKKEKEEGIDKAKSW